MDAHSDEHPTQQEGSDPMDTLNLTDAERDDMAVRAAATEKLREDADRAMDEARRRQEEERKAEEYRKKRLDEEAERRRVHFLELAERARQAQEEALRAGLPDPASENEKRQSNREQRARQSDFLADAAEQEMTELIGWRIGDVANREWRAALEDYVRYVTSPGDALYRNLILFGPSGSGKSTSSLAVGRELVKAGLSVRAVKHATYLTTLRNREFPPLHSEMAYRRRYTKCDVLILDDLGAAKAQETVSTDFATSETVQLVDARDGKFTIITTNCTSEQLKAMYTERVTSRIGKQAMVLPMIGPDLRAPAVWG